MKNYVVLLATDDTAVEASVKEVTTRAECGLNCVKDSREAFSIVADGAMDGFWNQDMAVVDLDLEGNGRALLRATGGALPIIAITSKVMPWLSGMLRRHRVAATLIKPVSLESLSAAFECVRRLSGVAGVHAS